MIRVISNVLKRLSVGLMICIMGALMVNKAIYTHIHVLPNGSIVAHAHPFSNSTEGNPNSSHQHSNTEFFFLDQLNILMLFFSAAFVLKQFATSIGFIEPATDHLFTTFVPLSPGRSPPACM